MSSSDAQKSEIHDQTADASTSPNAESNAATTPATRQETTKASHPKDIPASDAQTIIISDESADGGPVVIQSQEPALNPPQTPQSRFPADGIADVDVVSDDARPAKLRPTKA